MDQARSAVAGLQGSLAADAAAVESARVQLSYTVITAPIDGRVGSVASKLGNSIRAADGTPLVTINQLRPIYVSFSTPQTDFSALQQALAAGPVAVRVKPPGATAVAETGQITFIENAVDTMTNTVGVKATVANDETRLWPGEFVDVLMTVRIDPAAVVVPSEAVQAGPSGTFAFVIGADDKVAMRPVEVSRTISGETVIASGLASGERVVTSGQIALEPGSKVRVKTAESTGKDRAP